MRSLEKQGHRVTLLPVDRHGLVSPDDLERLIEPATLLVSVAHASGEIGTLQPLAEICRVAHARGVPVHTDATMTAGALPWPSGADQPDLVTLTPHLFYGPPGVAALRLRHGLRLAPLVEGGAQEGGLRAGTEALALIVGFGVAARLASERREQRVAHASALAGTARRILTERLDDLEWTGHPTRRIPGHLSLCVRGIEAEALLQELDREGIEAASGSACTTGARKPSHVLQAIGIDAVLARGAMTLSFGEGNSEADLETIGALLPRAIARLRSLAP